MTESLNYIFKKNKKQKKNYIFYTQTYTQRECYFISMYILDSVIFSVPYFLLCEIRTRQNIFLETKSLFCPHSFILIQCFFILII